MSDIFISYARADREKAELLANAFFQKGWSVWWDREIPPGRSFDEVIENALSSARCVIVLWSKDSVSSRWVKTEAAEGAARGILVPALIENVRIPLEFKRIEAADLSDWRGDATHAEFNQLLRTVAGLLGGSPAQQINRISTSAGLRFGGGWKIVPAILAMTVGVISLVLVLRQSDYFDRRESQSIPPARDTAPGALPVEEQASSPPLAKPKPGTPPQSSVINLVSAENGGHVIVGSNDRWSYTIDGDEKNWQYIDIGVLGSWAVYGFRDEKAAVFDTFKVLIPGAETWNLKDFELLAGNDSPNGKFDSIGKFQIQNMRFFKDPYQEFRFPPVKARYLKVRVISSQGFSSVGVYEFQLLGVLEN
jgi:hypothetical protein